MQNSTDQITKDPWPIKWLYYFCKPYYADQIAGDLLEIFYRQEGRSKSSLKLFWMTIGFLRLRYLKSMDEVFKITGLNMYRNYFKISLRNLLKHKGFSALNITGLAVGLAGCLLIVVHLLNELSYDDFYPDKENIYYVANGSSGRYSPTPLLNTMQEELPDVITGTRIWSSSDVIGKVENQIYKLPQGLTADSTFFDVFPQQFIQGTPETALTEPGSVVLTSTIAANIFGSEDPMGQKMVIEGRTVYVRAIVSDPPKNTTVPFDYIVDMPRLPFITNGNWTGNSLFTYVKLVPSADIEGIHLQFIEFIRTYAKQELESYGYSVDQYLEYRGAKPFTLVPLLDIHLRYPGLSQGKGGSMQQVWIMAIIAGMLLIIAVINYINMTTAKASLRLREIGMRKVFGSQRAEIVRQFFIESYVITIISFLLGILLCIVLLPYFNELVQRSLDIQDIFSGYAFMGMIVLLILAGAMSGVYPAIYLSGFSPINALKGEFAGNKVTLRKALVVFQFAVSIMLISFTFIVYNQVQLMSNFDTGWDREQTFAIFNMDAVEEDLRVIQNELSAMPLISSLSITNMMPSQRFIANWSYNVVGDEGSSFSPDHIFSDDNYLDVLDLELSKGRFFDKLRPADSMSIVINETFAQELGWEDPLGRKLTRGEAYDYTIIGVIKDFYPTSVKRNIRPLVIRYTDGYNKQANGSPILLLKLNGSYAESIRNISAVFEKYSDGYPFEGVFLSDSFNRLYENDQRFGKMFTTFSILALFIASLGLISLAAYFLERKSKEIAVRKVLGANVPTITWLMMREYLVLVTIGGSIAIPAVYFYSDYWLSNFANQIQIGWMIFIFPIFAVVVFTVLLVISQTLKAAQSNPTNALKQE